MSTAVRIGIYGASGSGKTTKARELIAGLNRLVAFDPLDEWAGAGWKRVTSVDQARQVMRQGWGSGFRVAYVPQAFRERHELHELCLLLRQAQAPYRDKAAAPALTLMVDELNTSFPVTGLTDDLYGFPELCSRGRHFHINIIGVTQRVAEVNTRWRGNLSAFYVFRQGDHRDVQTVAAMLGPELRDEIRALPDYSYLYFSKGRVTRGQTKAVAAPAAKTRARKSRRA